MTKVADPAVAEVFRLFPPRARTRLLKLRETIYAVAAQTPGVGELDETLKWGEPAYLTRAKSGSTVRLGWKEKAPDEVAVYFICTSGLVERFRELYPQTFRFDGNRALLFDLGAEVPDTELRHCIALALTWRAARKG